MIVGSFLLFLWLQLQDLARDYHRCTSNSGALLSGLGCGSNNSLQFVVMDSVSHPEFAPPGVLGRESDTAAVFYSCKVRALHAVYSSFTLRCVPQMEPQLLCFLHILCWLSCISLTTFSLPRQLVAFEVKRTVRMPALWISHVDSFGWACTILHSLLCELISRLKEQRSNWPKLKQTQDWENGKLRECT